MQISKRDPTQKREQDAVLTSADETLEEGLLEHQENDEEFTDGQLKDGVIVPVNLTDPLETPRSSPAS